MVIKKEEQSQAIKLRQQGFSYNEILQKVDVSKSTLSIWLRNTGVAKRHQQAFTLKRKFAQQKAQAACRNIRITREAEIIRVARKEISKLTQREFWLIGTALYWAEGSKQKPNIVSQKVSFNNSDPNMIFLFDKWVKTFLDRDATGIMYSLYIHQTGDIERAKKFWGKLLNTTIEKVYFKTHTPKTKHPRMQENYFGLLRIEVRRSTDLNRKIKGWTLGIIDGLNL